MDSGLKYKKIDKEVLYYKGNLRETFFGLKFIMINEGKTVFFFKYLLIS